MTFDEDAGPSHEPYLEPVLDLMTTRRNECVLAAEVVGGGPLAERLGMDEARRGIERCMNRVERVIESNTGRVLQEEPGRICVAFERCDLAVQAACEMLDRVSSLPPLSGVRLAIRVGLHYGGLDQGEAPFGEAAIVAHQLMEEARSSEALATGGVVMLLTPATRHFAGAGSHRSLVLDGVEWPVYTLGPKVGTTTSVPPASRLAQRLRVKHQQDVHILEELRPVLLLGRELGNDIVVIDPRASRQHARIERRREGFVLVDQSTNGTYVAVEGETERCVKHSEQLLTGQGRIGCGFSAGDIERDLIFFEVF